MHRRLTARVLLACYGMIALAGQGLHEFLDDDGCDRAGNLSRRWLFPRSMADKHKRLDSPSWFSRQEAAMFTIATTVRFVSFKH
jgi:hypothetical protein